MTDQLALPGLDVARYQLEVAGLARGGGWSSAGAAWAGTDLVGLARRAVAAYAIGPDCCSPPVRLVDSDGLVVWAPGRYAGGGPDTPLRTDRTEAVDHPDVEGLTWPPFVWHDNNRAPAQKEQMG